MFKSLGIKCLQVEINNNLICHKTVENITQTVVIILLLAV